MKIEVKRANVRRLRRVVYVEKKVDAGKKADVLEISEYDALHKDHQKLYEKRVVELKFERPVDDEGKPAGNPVAEASKADAELALRLYGSILSAVS
jgi:hypothetical protein